MGTRVIDIDPFDPASIRQANRMCRQWQQETEEKIDRFLQRVAEIGAKEAGRIYGSSVRTEAVKIDNRVWAVQANGKSVVFLEFGAGDLVNQSNKYAQALNSAGVTIEKGSWSREHAKQYAIFGEWEFPPGSGNIIKYVQPRNAMERAFDKIMLNYEIAAEDVFK